MQQTLGSEVKVKGQSGRKYTAKNTFRRDAKQLLTSDMKLTVSSSVYFLYI